MPELRPAYPLADARNAIMEAAIALFAERGFHGATMREIADRAGVSQGLLHHHFGGKEGLWNTVGERITDDFLTYMAEVVEPAESTPDSIPKAVRSYLNYWREHPAAFRFNLWRLLEGPAEERESRSETLNARAVPVFKRAQEAGFVRGDMPAGLALIIAGSLMQFWLHSQTEIRDALAVTGDEVNDEAFVEHVLDLIQTSPIPKRSTARPKGRKP
jgi:AcrR family transcriptional regulator